MTKRDFFRVIIKLFGLYQLLLVVFNTLPTFLSIAFVYVDLNSIVWSLGIFMVTIGIFITLIKKADRIIDFLQLGTGFDDEFIQFGKFNSTQIIKLAIILISGLLILNNISVFLTQSYYAFGENINGGVQSTFNILNGGAVDYSTWVVSGINIVVGYLMLTNYSPLANWLDAKTTPKEI